MKVLIVGDTHDDDQFVANILREARRFGVKRVVQLGDFGYPFNPNMLNSIYAWLDGDEEREFYWLDGNHDEHLYIRDTIIGDRGFDYPIPHFHARMFYCPRGSTTMIGDKKCMFLGGAYSIDKMRRTAYVSWWPQELITDDEVARAVTKKGIDVMFTHDSPPHEWLELELDKNGYKTDPQSFGNRQRLGYVCAAVKPKDLYHGHFHWRYDNEYNAPNGHKVRVHGVGANVSETGWRIDHTAYYGRNFLIEKWGDDDGTSAASTVGVDEEAG